MKEFWTAFLSAQQEFPPIQKDSFYALKDKEIWYASLGAIMRSIKPILHKHGIAITMPLEGNTVFVRFTHSATGQTQQSFSELCLSDVEKNDEKKRKSAITYQRRANLEGLAGVVATDDDDANTTVSQSDDEREYTDKWAQSSDLAKSMKLYDNIKTKHIAAYKAAFNKEYKNFVTASDIRKFLNDFSKEHA